MALADVEPFVAYRSNADVARYQSWESYTLEEGRALVDEMHASRPGIPGAWYQFALENVTSGELVGDLAARINPDEHRELEVGFTLAPQHQGKGYGTEALTGLLGYAFDSLGVRRVIAVTDSSSHPGGPRVRDMGSTLRLGWPRCTAVPRPFDSR